MLLKEPLIHFLVGAALVFAYFALIGGGLRGDDSVIVISQQDIQRMQQRWERDWRRPPEPAQLQQLIDEAVRDELLYREGLRLGLDRDDTVVRNRMIQKMRFLNDQDLRAATEQDLIAWLAQDPQKYQLSPSYNLQQVYLGQEPANGRIEELVAELNSGSMSQEQVRTTDAKPLSIADQMQAASQEAVAREFGEDFASRLAELPVGNWVGPVWSGYGAHLVRVNAVAPSPPASLQDASIRQQVENDWRASQRGSVMRQNIETLRGRYDVVIEQP